MEKEEMRKKKEKEEKKEEEGVMRNAMTTRAPGGANNKTCSINQFARMFHTLFGLLNTNLKLLG